MIYITGDTHREFSRIVEFCKEQNTTTDDVLIILGDAGINFFGDFVDDPLKFRLSKLAITLFCVHGNHECRPTEELGYEISQFHGGAVYVQKQYPNLVFAIDGEVYDFAGNQCIVCGGAYSVDKNYRLANGLPWFPDEQPSSAIRERVMNKLEALDYKVDVFLSHTCPLKYRPADTFLPFIDERDVDVATERWFGEIEEKLKYRQWYCAHFHITLHPQNANKITFLFEDIVELPPNENRVEEPKTTRSESL